MDIVEVFGWDGGGDVVVDSGGEVVEEVVGAEVDAVFGGCEGGGAGCVAVEEFAAGFISVKSKRRSQ